MTYVYPPIKVSPELLAEEQQSTNGITIFGTFIGYDLIILIAVVLIIAYIALR